MVSSQLILTNLFYYKQLDWLVSGNLEEASRMNERGGLKPGKASWKGRLGTVDLLINIGCFVKKKKYIASIWKPVGLN
jgi:hypothetical protein